MIEAQSLTKRYGSTAAVDRISFTVRPGLVTGFLGPNGAGKSTTMRMIIGLDRPTAGTVTVNGQPYGQLKRPLHEVGALLEAGPCTAAVAPTITCSAWPRATGSASAPGARGAGDGRPDEVAGKRAKGFSLGMGQRLGVAAALLGDPGVLVFDEPVNGLDPEGILWIRTLLTASRRRAARSWCPAI